MSDHRPDPLLALVDGDEVVVGDAEALLLLLARVRQRDLRRSQVHHLQVHRLMMINELMDNY